MAPAWLVTPSAETSPSARLSTETRAVYLDGWEVDSMLLVVVMVVLSVLLASWAVVKKGKHPGTLDSRGALDRAAKDTSAGRPFPE
jgi:hypothetical protein